MTKEEQKFWEEWFNNNRYETEEYDHDEQLLSSYSYLPEDKFIEAIKLAQEMQRQKDAEIAMTHQPFLLLPERMPDQLREEIANAIMKQEIE